MTADSATSLDSTVAVMPRLRPYMTPSRVAYHHPITNHERMQAELAAEHAEQQTALTLPDTRHGGPHPGDIVYWVACLGGACLLVLCAIH